MNILISSPEANVFSLLAITKQQMITIGKKEQVTEMFTRVQTSKGYEQAIEVMNEYIYDKINIVE